MAGIIKRAGQVIADRDGMPIRKPVKYLKGLICICDVIQGLDFFEMMGFDHLVNRVQIQIVAVLLKYFFYLFYFSITDFFSAFRFMHLAQSVTGRFIV